LTRSYQILMLYTAWVVHKFRSINADSHVIELVIKTLVASSDYEEMVIVTSVACLIHDGNQFWYIYACVPW
jgi:hypothetical protein